MDGFLKRGERGSNWRSLLRWVGAACATSLLLVLGIILSAPLWIDAAAVKAQVVSIVNQATHGQARYERVEFHFLPRPGVALERPAFDLPGTLELEAKSASVDLDFHALLTGRVHTRNIRVDSAKIRLQLPEPQASASTKPFSLRQTEQQIRAVLDGIVEGARDAHAELVDASIELRIGQRPALLLEHLAIELATEGDAVIGKLSCGSDLWERLAVDVRVNRKDLVGEAHAQVSGLRAERLGAVLGGGGNWPISAGDMNATLRLQMHGLANAQGEAIVSAAKVAMQFGTGRLEAAGPMLDAAVRIENGTMELTLRRLTLETPHLEAVGKLSWSERDGYMLEAQTQDADVPALLAAARDLAPELDWLAQPRAQVERGTITSLKVSSRGATFEELVRPTALQASAEVSGVEVRVPEIDLRVRELSATAALAAGELRIQDVMARTTKSTLRGGMFVTTLGAEPLPLHAQVTIDLDLPEALAMARRVIRDRDTLRQLDQLKLLDGGAMVRVTLGESLDRLAMRIEASELKGSARHDAIPFPIRIARGALTYANDVFSVDALEGAIGRSSFAGVGARLGMTSPYALSAGRGSAVLALDELFGWAATQPDFAQRLEGVETVSGNLALALTRLEGPARSPKKLQFQVAATPKRVSIHAPKLGPPVALDGGSIELSPRSIGARGIRVSALDAGIEVGGRTDDYLDGLDDLNATLSGTLGPQALAWAFARAGLPESLRLRDALTLSGMSADWSKSGKMAARGSVSIAGGPVIGFAASRTPQRMDIESVTVRDEGSDATLGGSVEGTRFEARFKGRLAGTSIEHVFVRSPVALGTLEGDFEGSGDWTNPSHGNATGFLNASNIVIPAGLPDPVVLERLSLEAKGPLVSIKSARLASGETRIDVSGSVDRSGKKFRVDADIRADTVVFALPPAKEAAQPDATKPAKDSDTTDSDTAASLERQGNEILDRIPVTGEVRVDVGHVRAGLMEISPLIGSISLETGRVDLRIKQASLCTIGLSGGLTLREGIVEARAALHARAADLDQSIICLTERRMQVTGRLDLDAQFTTSGERKALADKLQGTFTAVSRDGRIEKFDALSKVFDLLNVTEVVHGSLPDLNQKGMGYKSATVKGRVQGHTVFLDEFVLDASRAKIAAYGRVDYVTGKIDVNALVAPLKTLNWVLDKIPILRQIMGGTVLALPVHIGGKIGDPQVVPLGTEAVGSRLVDIVTNTLKLPVDLVNAFSAEPAGAGKSPKK